MYEAARARPAGPSSAARLAYTAADLGFDGLVIANPADEPSEFDAAVVREATGVDVAVGVELTADDPSGAAGAIGRYRPSTTVLCLRGGSRRMNAYAVQRDRVDVLTRPMAGNGDLDHVKVRTAAEHGVRLAVDLGPVLREAGEARTAAIAGLRKLRELLEDADAPYVLTASAGSHLELRSPRDLAAAATVAGFDREAVERGLAEWGHLAERNRARQSDAFVEPGVRREDDA